MLQTDLGPCQPQGCKQSSSLDVEICDGSEYSLKAAFFGSVTYATYATYDLTDLATIRGWPLTVTLVDSAWGATLCGAATFVGTGLGRKRIDRR